MGFQNCAVKVGLRWMMTPNASGWRCDQPCGPETRTNTTMINDLPIHVFIVFPQTMSPSSARTMPAVPRCLTVAPAEHVRYGKRSCRALRAAPGTPSPKPGEWPRAGEVWTAKCSLQSYIRSQYMIGTFGQNLRQIDTTPTVCPSHDSARTLLYQELPTSIQWWRGMARRRKEERRAGIA
jgi:hypothetical protein